MKTLNTICIAVGVLLPALLVSPSAQAFESARLWEMDIASQIDQGDVKENTSWLCLPKSEWTNPPVDLTGPQCDGQTYTYDGDAVTWTAQCESATGEGAWTFSRGGKSIEGQSRIASPQGLYLTRIEGKAVDSCTL